MRGLRSLTVAAMIAAAIVGPAAAANHGSHGGNGSHHSGLASGWNNGSWVHGFNGARYGWW